MYDSVCKFLAESFAPDLASWLLGEPIALTQLSPTELSLEPIRADTLILYTVRVGGTARGVSDQTG